MMNRLKTSLAIGLTWALASGCASQVEPTTGAAVDSHAVMEAGGLEGIETTSGVTDIEAGLELASGSTDEALAGVATATTPRTPGTLHRAAASTSPMITTPTSTGAGVSHGSPQPLDPKPTDSAAQSSGTK